MYSLLAKWLFNNGCEDAVYNYQLVTENAEIAKKLQIYHLDACASLCAYLFFPPAGMKFITMCSCLDKPPWGSFHASSDLKLLTSSHHANEVSGRAEHLYTTARYHCWRTAYTSIMLKMGAFNLRGNTLLKVLFSLKSTYNVYQSFMRLKQS